MENHLTELLDGPTKQAYSEAACREPDARPHAGGASLGRQTRRRGWAAEPSFRAVALSGENAPRYDPREPQPGVIYLVGTLGSPPSPLPPPPERPFIAKPG